jgi:hypothetical protein
MLRIDTTLVAIPATMCGLVFGAGRLSMGKFAHQAMCIARLPIKPQLAIAGWLSVKRPNQTLRIGMAGVIPKPSDRRAFSLIR